jgi:hypothetical protein
MDYSRMGELLMKHRHSDGSWGSFEPKQTHHDPADHDPERRWSLGRIFVCRSCEEEILVETATEDHHDR